jgi:hypothetical protein
MEDARVAVSRLIFQYADRLDRGDYEGVADLLAHAEVSSRGSVLRGREAVLAMYERSTRRHPGDGTPLTQHVTTNLMIDVDEAGRTASCQSYFTVLQAVPGALALQPIVAGRYEDKFEQANGEWRFSARAIEVRLVGDLSQHLMLGLYSPG